MNYASKHEGINCFLASLLILLFVYTATSKMITHDQFERVLLKMPYLGGMATLLSYAIPAIEVFTSLLLLLPSTRALGFGISFLLLLAFTLYLGVMLLVAPQLPCSCGGVVGQLGWRGHLLFNITLLLVAFAGWKNKKLSITMQRFIRINPLSAAGRRSRKPVKE